MLLACGIKHYEFDRFKWRRPPSLAHFPDDCTSLLRDLWHAPDWSHKLWYTLKRLVSVLMWKRHIFFFFTALCQHEGSHWTRWLACSRRCCLSPAFEHLHKLITSFEPSKSTLARFNGQTLLYMKVASQNSSRASSQSPCNGATAVLVYSISDLYFTECDGTSKATVKVFLL